MNPQLNLDFYRGSLISLLEKSPHIKLEYLNLEGNKIGDNLAKEICDPLLNVNTFKHLNLNDNELTDRCLPMISEVVARGPLEELHLKFNRIKVKGGNSLAQAIEMSRSLQILDLSFNSLGSFTENKKVEKKKGPKTPKRKKKEFSELAKAA